MQYQHHRVEQQGEDGHTVLGGCRMHEADTDVREAGDEGCRVWWCTPGGTGRRLCDLVSSDRW